MSPEEENPELFNFESYPQIFSAEALLKDQFSSALDHLRYELSKLDMPAYKNLFWEGNPFEFKECDDSLIVKFQMFGNHSKEIDRMLKGSRSKKMKELKERLSRLPKIKIEHETGEK